MKKHEHHTKKKSIAVFVGSLRKESLNRKMAQAIAQMAPANLKMEILEIGNLPMYNQDLDDNPPTAWLNFAIACANTTEFSS